MDKNIFLKWFIFGYQLGRLEFVWDSDEKEAIDATKQIKNDLNNILAKESVTVNDKDFPSYCRSIINYYMMYDMDIFSFILIGISAFRCYMATHFENKEFNELSRSALDSVSSTLVPDKDLLFSVIKLNCNKHLRDISEVIYNFLNEDDDENLNINENTKNNSYIFISYSSKDRDIAVKIKEMLESVNINTWIAPESIPTGSDYTNEIVDAIEGSSGVLLVLTKNSQESKWVPKELDIAITNDKVIFPIHVDISSIIKSMKFRLSDSQIIEASGSLDMALVKLIKDIQKHLNQI